MVRPDGDTTLLFFTANSVYYVNQILDPFFLAIYADQALIPSVSSDQTYFLPYYPVNVMGCLDQYTIINPINNRSTQLVSQSGLIEAIQSLDLSLTQYVTAQRLIHSFSYSNTYSSTFGFGANALKASDQVLNFKCLNLPFNQWQKEVEGWFETSLVKIQAYTVEYASNIADLGIYSNISYPGSNGSTENIWKHQCDNQKIRNTGGYQTFSVLGIVIIGVVGLFIFFIAKVGLKWSKFVKGIRRKHNRNATEDSKKPKSTGALMYAADGKFQLQRMALEEAGYCTGKWKDLDSDYPWTLGSEMVPRSFWTDGVLVTKINHETDNVEAVHPDKSTNENEKKTKPNGDDNNTAPSGNDTEALPSRNENGVSPSRNVSRTPSNRDENRMPQRGSEDLADESGIGSTQYEQNVQSNTP
jgi:hypothetical protein